MNKWLHPSNILASFLLAFLVGVLVRSLWNLSEMISWTLLIGAIIFLAIDYKNRLMMSLFFVLLGLALGIGRADKELNKIYERPEEKFSGMVQILKEPERKSEYQKLTVSELRTNNEEGITKKDKILLFAPLAMKYQYGEKLKINCQLVNPENQYEKFNYQRYLAKDDIYQICRSAKIEKTGEFSEKSGVKVFRIILKIKYAIEEKLAELFPSPEGDYLAGLLLGGDDRLPQEVQENFRRTGTTHTVAVSGYNITIIAQFLVLLAIGLGFWRSQAFWLATLGIGIFVLMIGLPSSAVRAALMGVLILWATKNGRLANSTRVAILAGVIMVWISPLILLYDAGFQLSFLATLGIVWIYGPLSERFQIENDFLELKSIVLVTIAAQLGVMGLIVYSFETFSPISLLANLLILPAVPYIMALGSGAILLSFIFSPLAKLMALPVWLALHLEIEAIEWLAGFSWASVEIGNVGWFWLVGYYLLLIGIVVKLRGSKQ